MAVKVSKKLFYPNQNQRNSYAKSLENQVFRQRIIKSKKVYDRKKFKI